MVADFVLGEEATFAGGSAITSVVGSMLVVSRAEASHLKLKEFLEQVLLVENGFEGVTSGPDPVKAGMGGMMWSKAGVSEGFCCRFLAYASGCDRS